MRPEEAWELNQWCGGGSYRLSFAERMTALKFDRIIVAATGTEEQVIEIETEMAWLAHDHGKLEMISGEEMSNKHTEPMVA